MNESKIFQNDSLTGNIPVSREKEKKHVDLNFSNFLRENAQYLRSIYVTVFKEKGKELPIKKDFFFLHFSKQFSSSNFAQPKRWNRIKTAIAKFTEVAINLTEWQPFLSPRYENLAHFFLSSTFYLLYFFSILFYF